MTAPQALFPTYAPQPRIIVDSAEFDGTNDYMTTGAGFTGASDSKLGIFSCWIRIDGGDGTNRILFMGTTTVGGTTFRLDWQLDTSNRFTFRTLDSGGGTAVITSNTLSQYAASSTWLHYLTYWDMTDTAKRGIYINDVDDAQYTAYQDLAADLTLADWSIGALPDGTAKVNACFAEVYFAPAQYLDLSVVANRRKFISASGRPVYLGADGSRPTGTAPIMYQRLADGAAASTFATNLGTGGDFTITGTLTTGSTSPSD